MLNRISKALISIVALGALPAMAQSNSQCSALLHVQRTDLTDLRAILARSLRLTETARGSDFMRTSVSTTRICADSLPFLHRWSSRENLFAVLPVIAAARTNSAYARDRNDGALWNGVGTNVQFQAGAAGQWRFLRAAFYPRWLHQENKHFEVPASPFNGSEFANPYVPGIDLPKRMGPSSFSSFEVGNSFIEARSSVASIAFSNENLWLGPSQIHSLLLSNTAPGFPHLRFGTERPIDLRVLWLEAHAFYGSVQESDYMGAGDNRRRLYQASLISVEPKFLPGLHFGVARVLLDTAGATGRSFGYYLKRLADSPFWDSGKSGLDPADRQGALYARYILPESGFEAYVEWGREDFPFSLLNLVLEPDYSQVWTAGAQKIFINPRRLTRVYGELVHLGQAAPIRGGRDLVRFGATRAPGFTNRGQMLGPSVGPGSDAQTFGVDIFDANSRTGFMVERVRYDDDSYYQYFSRRFSESRHDIELTGEARRTQFIGPVEIEAAIRLSRRWNRDFLSALNDEPGITAETNFGSELAVHWTPRISF